ncbi:MAG: GNAT family N-acetyltransferase [Firmicutes bacterium]|nr:GNAT family N-acetyltransferase [Bacillota bacterium]MCD7831588.1 GNAT family N-acetyltransferase [Bacillota bacterium]MCD8314382.1 GNAT family N-acetyltransferase [Bacillota bacterium]
MNAEFKIKGKTLETDRLILRPFERTDLSDFYEYASVDGVGEMAGWRHHESIEKTEEILNMFINEDKVFALVYKENSRVIGSLGVEEYGMEDKLSEFDGLRGREIGYALSKDYWGHGIMPEAVTAVTEYLFSQMNLDFLLCGYFLFNARSKRVQEKCGFKPYRSVVMNTGTGTEEKGILSLLTNPNKQIKLEFSHPETLIYEG